MRHLVQPGGELHGDWRALECGVGGTLRRQLWTEPSHGWSLLHILAFIKWLPSKKNKRSTILRQCVDCRRSLTLNDHFSGNAFKTRRKNSKCCKNSRRKNFFFGTSELSNPGWNHSEWPDIRHQTYAGIAHASDLQRSNAATGREIAAAEKRIGNQNFLCGIWIQGQHLVKYL